MSALQDDVELVANSPLFDKDYYLRQCPDDVADAAAHYVTEGWRLNLDPGPAFSNRHYLTRHGDVRKNGNCPLAHYLSYGRDEGRAIVAPSLLVPAPDCPSDEEWRSLAGRPDIGRAATEAAAGVVDIIIPVFKGREETLRCIHCVLRAEQRTPYRIVVLDDHGPDAGLSLSLDTLAAEGLIELHRFESNVGFVQASNFGMRLHPDRDVVLLNSDTAVHNDWLDRLRAAAYRTPRTATVTPFSNNAEICSYPQTVQDNILALELSDRDLDRLAAACNAEGEVEIPTGVGFCMYVRRAALDEVGLLDAAAFGRGYGEENDFCQRAERAGWRNILAADIFVRHYGGVSFGAEKLRRIEEAMGRVEQLNPGYEAAIGRFRLEDPVLPWRRALDVARVKRVAGERPILIVTHTWGGGTERHVAELEALLKAAGQGSVRCCVDAAMPDRLLVGGSTIAECPNLPRFDLSRDDDAFVELMRLLGVAHVHIHHLAGMPDRCVDFFGRVCRKAGLDYDVTLHDYMAICPRIFLVDRRGVYCGEPSVEECDACVQHAGSFFGKPKLTQWRGMFHDFLGRARRVFVPDPDVARRLARYFPDIQLDVRSHPDSFDAPAAVGRPYPRRARVRTVAVIGALGPPKGSELLLRCAALAAEVARELRFVVVGYTDRDADFAGLGNTRILGRYEDDELQDRLTQVDPDLCWFPAVWPETYSYTLSAAFRAGLFPVAFDIGAPARRIRESGWGHLMPMTAMLDPFEIIAHLSTVAIPARPAGAMPAVSYSDPLVSYYGFETATLPPRGARQGAPGSGCAGHLPAAARTVAAE